MITNEQKLIFKRAAELLEDGESINKFCCNAITLAAFELGLAPFDALNTFARVFKPEPRAEVYWFQMDSRGVEIDTQTARIIALLSLTHL